MNAKKNIFLTGITGFLGSFLAKEFLLNGYCVFGLARAGKDKNAYQRTWDAVRSVFYDDEWDEQLVKQNLKVFEGNIDYQNLGIIDKKDRDFLIQNTDIIIHSAALTELNVDLVRIRKINVEGTRNILNFAFLCKNEGRLKKFNHISTIYVCGDYKGNFDETMLDVGQKFNNTYSQSKFETEKLISQYRKKKLWIDVFRPSMVVGDSVTGKTNQFRNIYQFIHLCRLQIIDEWPLLDASVNLVPVDFVSKSIFRISKYLTKKNQNYHIFPKHSFRIKEIISLASLIMKFKKPTFVKSNFFDWNKPTPVQASIINKVLLGFYKFSRIDSRATHFVLKRQGFEFSEVTQQHLNEILTFFYKQDKKTRLSEM